MTEFAFVGNLVAAGMGPLIAVYAVLGVMLLLGAFALVRLAVLAKKTKEQTPPREVETPNCEECEKLLEKDREIDALQERIHELEATPAPAPEIPEAERSLSESLAVASASGKSGLISKKSIIAYLTEKYGDKLELNGRENRTPNGKLLLSDNHFAFSPAGKRVCFTYVYETDEGNVLSLIKLDEPYVQSLRAEHPAVVRSAFPKNKAKDWYSVVADDTFDEAAYYAVFDHAIALIRDQVESVPAPAPTEEKEEEIAAVTLSESLAAAKETGAVGVVNKKSIIEHLSETFGDKVELNGRANRTPNGKLLLSDNHFAFSPEGKRVCFAYVYEDDDGKIMILLRTTAEHAKDIRAAHKATGGKSAFPKNKERDWYSVVVDESFTEADVYAELDRAARNIIGTATLSEEEVPAPEEVAATTAESLLEEEPAVETETREEAPAPAEEEKTLKETFAAAKEKGALGVVSKKSIFNHLADVFDRKVELNGRENYTPNGKLLLSDNHFAFAPDGKRVCFTYIYEDDQGRISILLRTTAEHAAAIHKAHPATGNRSAFPKNKERDWYSVVVDESFTEADVYAELDRAARHIIEEEAPASLREEKEEVSLKSSLAAAKERGALGVVTKKSVIEYLNEKYKDRVETNGRENRTPNGKLLLSDNHFALGEGKRVCFTYIYEDEGRIVMLIRASEAQAAAIHKAHPATGNRSAFPKNKERDWYSVVVDESFTESEVQSILDGAIEYVLAK